MDDIDLTEISDTSFVADTPRYVHQHVVNNLKWSIEATWIYFHRQLKYVYMF